MLHKRTQSITPLILGLQNMPIPNFGIVGPYCSGVLLPYWCLDDSESAYSPPCLLASSLPFLRWHMLTDAWVLAGGNAEILTHEFVHRSHVDIFGTYYPKPFITWYGNIRPRDHCSMAASCLFFLCCLLPGPPAGLRMSGFPVCMSRSTTGSLQQCGCPILLARGINPQKPARTWCGRK